MGFINIFSGDPRRGDIQKATANIPNIPIYKPNFDAFVNWSRLHRDHQVEALRSVEGNNIGQICLPTGTGKTRIQVAIHLQHMIDMLRNRQYGVFLTSAHRLALCSQLLEEIIVIAVNAGIPFDILFVGSSRFAEDKVYAKFKNQGFNRYVNEAVSTTQSDEIKKIVRRSQMRERHVICVSTYHSFDKLNVLNDIEVCTYDEAHVVVGENFLENILSVRSKIKRNYFFTATRKVQGQHEGMNNEELFGKVLYEISPRRMIEAGEIVPPRLHIIQTNEQGDYNNHTMLVKTIIIGYEQHRVLVKESSYDPNSIGCKLLITTTGNLELFEIHNDEAFREFCLSNGIKVFAYSSEYGSFINFQPTSREEAIRTMRELKDDEDAIMLHIDILTEGIDLPSITGVMPFRELNTLKLLQTIGRSARLMGDDRRRLYNGEINPQDWQNYIKPCCWVIFPEHFRSLGNVNAMKDALRTIVNTYAIPIEEYNTIDQYKSTGKNDVERITEFDQPTRKDKETDLIHVVEELMLERFSFLTNENTLEVLKGFFNA